MLEALDAVDVLLVTRWVVGEEDALVVAALLALLLEVSAPICISALMGHAEALLQAAL